MDLRDPPVTLKPHIILIARAGISIDNDAYGLKEMYFSSLELNYPKKLSRDRSTTSYM